MDTILIRFARLCRKGRKPENVRLDLLTTDLEEERKRLSIKYGAEILLMYEVRYSSNGSQGKRE